MRRLFCLLGWLMAATFVLFSVRARAEPVDVALVLAMDVSGSVSAENWTLQRDGVADAIASRQFAVAVRSGQIGRIALAVVLWGSDAQLAIGWRVIETAGEARAFAADVRDMTRTESGGTCMANALVMAGMALLEWEGDATRRVVDVSGDGSNNCNAGIDDARLGLIAQGITINGLPIVTPSEPQIAEWYERNLIGGPGAFIVVADGFASFAEAIQRKMIVETAEARP